MPYPPKFDIGLCTQAASASVEAYEAFKKPFKPGDKRAGFAAVKTIYQEPGGKGPVLGWIGEDGKGMSVVAFRGTKGLKDLVTDFTGFKKATPKFFASIATHQGFLDMYMDAAEGVRSDLRSLAEAKKASKILVCGHSLGGALATLCALDLRAEDHKDVHMYSFGAPKLFADAKVAKQYLAIVPKAYRTVDPEDPVPKLNSGCEHFDQAWMPAKTPGKTGFDAHDMKNYVELIKVGKGS